MKLRVLQMNGNAESSLDHLYPLPSSAQRSHVVAPNGNVPGYVPCLPSSGMSSSKQLLERHKSTSSCFYFILKNSKVIINNSLRV